jgi:hypothetical protein
MNLEVPENNILFLANPIPIKFGISASGISISFNLLLPDIETPDASFIQDVFEFNKFICLSVLRVPV